MSQDAAPIPASTETPTPSSNDVLGSLSSSERDHWRMTGELPTPAATEVETPSGDESAEPTTSEPDPVPTSDATPEPKKLGKPRDDMRARLGQEVERTKAATARAEAAERRAAELEARHAPVPTSDPVPTGEPKLDDFLDQPDPYAALTKATAKWAIDQFRQEQAWAQRRDAAQARIEAIGRAGEGKYPDWLESLNAPDVNAIQIPGPIMQLLHESPLSVDVLYHLSKHPAEVRALAAMEPLAAAKTIGSLETRLSGDTSRPAAKTTSAAPPPPTTLGTKPAVPGDDIEAALKAGDFSRYRELQNARELAGAKR